MFKYLAVSLTTYRLEEYSCYSVPEIGCIRPICIATTASSHFLPHDAAMLARSWES